jgi:hypothetical protein
MRGFRSELGSVMIVKYRIVEYDLRMCFTSIRPPAGIVIHLVTDADC